MIGHAILLYHVPEHGLGVIHITLLDQPFVRVDGINLLSPLA